MHNLSALALLITFVFFVAILAFIASLVVGHDPKDNE